MEQNVRNKIYKNIKIFAKNLRLERESRGWTQRQVADMMEIKTQSYQAYESGVAVPSLENLLKIVYIFDLSLDNLFEIEV